MKITQKVEEKDSLRIVVDSNEESLFYLLKQYLSQNPDIDIVGVYKEHHLVDETELFIKVKKGKPIDTLKKALKDIKTQINKQKVK
jgi:DNA-directed RNA polymerase subunit L